MESTLSVDSAAALFGAMAVLAALPSVSVFVVSARSTTCGFMHGAATAAGVLAGDILFILLAIFGLAVLVEALGGMFFLVKYAGGAYLIWLGIGIWRSKSQRIQRSETMSPSLASSFTAGLLVTLADQKAIFFYLGFLPAFLNLAALSYADVGAILIITIAAVGGVKLCYAYAAGRANVVFGGRAGDVMRTVGACIMVLAGVVVIARA